MERLVCFPAGRNCSHENSVLKKLLRGVIAILAPGSVGRRTWHLGITNGMFETHGVQPHGQASLCERGNSHGDKPFTTFFRA